MMNAMKRSPASVLLPLFVLFSISILTTACGSGGDDGQRISATVAGEGGGLTAFEMEHGIGPVTEELDLGVVDAVRASEGRNIFQTKCEACHNMDSRMVGPALGDVLERRSPEFVMNMILNPSGMTQDHPEGQKLLREYFTAMPFQNVSMDEARMIVEYLRDQSAN